MENIIYQIYQIFFTGTAFLLIFQSLVLFARSHNNKARKTLGWVFLIFGITYAVKMISSHFGTPIVRCGYFREEIILVGSFYITLMYLFPIQVLIPHWLNWKRIILLFSPILLLSAVYLSVMNCMHMHSEVLESYSQILDSFWHFNVWFRIFFLICNLTIIILLMVGIRVYEIKYKQWINDNYSNHEYIDISWLKWYNVTMIAITICYIGTLMVECMVPVIIHTAVLMTGFSFLFYKGLFYESPYPKDFQPKLKEENSSLSSPEENSDYLPFEARIPVYVATVKEWLISKQPYLYKDLKLTDVSKVLPLNRSYLSRVFNEGFGQSFSEVIREYRVEYSKELMKKNPTLPMSVIAEMSGFNSDSTFIRAFRQINDITPAQYKVQKGKSEN